MTLSMPFPIEVQEIVQSKYDEISNFIKLQDLYKTLQLLRLEFDPNYKFHFHFDNTELILHFELDIEQNDEWHKVGQAELNLVQGTYDLENDPVRNGSSRRQGSGRLKSPLNILETCGWYIHPSFIVQVLEYKVA